MRTVRPLVFLVALLTSATVVASGCRRTSVPDLVVDQLDVKSPAEEQGLQVGDRVLAYDGRPLFSPADLDAAVENIVGEPPAELLVRRGAETRALKLRRGPLGLVLRFDLSADVLKLYEDGKTELGRQQIEPAVSSWKKAARAATAADHTTSAAWLLWLAGRALESRQLWEAALTEYQAAWKVLDKSGDAATRATVLASLGRCSHKLNNPADAEKWFVLARDENQKAGRALWMAANLNDLGVIARARGDLAAAQDHHARALEIRRRLVPGSLAVAESLDNAGLVAFDRGVLDGAERLQSESLDIRDRLAPGSLAVATSHNNLGNIAWSQGDLHAAMERHNRALALRERHAPDSLDVAASLSNLGLVAWSRGDLLTAGDYHGRALEIRERLAPDSMLVAASLSNMGEVERYRGDLVRARDYLSRSSAIKQKLAPDSVSAALTLNNLGELAREVGDFHAAQNYHDLAYRIREQKAPDSLPVANSLNSLGETARARGDLASAERYHTRARELRDRLAPNSLDVAETIHHLGDVALGLGVLDRATDYYTRALEIRRRLAPDSLEVAYSLAAVGNTARARGDFAVGRDAYRQAILIAERLAPGSLDVASTLVGMGEVEFAQGRFSEARQLFERSVAIVEAHRRQIPSSEARALLLALHSTPHAGLLRTQIALRDHAGAFATLERARARSLVELLAERRLDFRAHASVELLARQDELDQRRSLTYRALADTSSNLTNTRAGIDKLDPAKDAGQLSALAASARTLERRLVELRQDVMNLAVQQRDVDVRIRRTSPRLAALQYPQPLDLRGAQGALDAGTLLLAYVADEEATYLFAVTRTDFQLFTLPIDRRSLTAQVREFRVAVSGERLGDPTASGQQLYDTLVRPAQRLIGRAQRILICPDGPLQTLPFAPLVSGRDPLRYFIEDRPLHMTSSMTVYAQTRKHDSGGQSLVSGSRNTTLLAFGDPIYTKSQAAPAVLARSETLADQRRDFNLKPLPHTGDEVRAIVGLFGGSGRARLGSEATEAAVKAEAMEVGILHIASHGWTDETLGLNSGLALSQPEALGRRPTTEDDGLLQAWEVFERVRLRAKLVVLSACRTALGEDVRGEGLVGLTRAFHYAGASSVAVSLWDVSDAATVRLMKAFYQELLKGASKDVALQRAMTTSMRGDSSRRHHPYYWAAFVLIGDWQ